MPTQKSALIGANVTDQVLPMRSAGRALAERHRLPPQPCAVEGSRTAATYATASAQCMAFRFQRQH